MPDERSNSGPQPFLDLAAPERLVRIRFGDHSAIHVFRRLTLEDWLGYLRDLESETLVEGEEIAQTARVEEAGRGLWERAILRLEGYQNVGEDWKQKMPVSHQLAAIEGLQEIYVQPGGADPFDLSPSSRLVILEAAWNLERFENLRHWFREPTAEDELAFRRLRARRFRISGTRRGSASARIRQPIVLKELCALFDRLGERLEGYTPAAPAELDPLLKQAAALALFEPPLSGEVGAEQAR